MSLTSWAVNGFQGALLGQPKAVQGSAAPVTKLRKRHAIGPRDVNAQINIYITKASFAELELPRLLNEVKYSNTGGAAVSCPEIQPQPENKGDHCRAHHIFLYYHVLLQKFAEFLGEICSKNLPNFWGNCSQICSKNLPNLGGDFWGDLRKLRNVSSESSERKSVHHFGSKMVFWEPLACLLACSLARLLACSLARLLACSLARLLACSLARLLACSLARLLACSLARLLACSLARLLACSLARLLACSLARLLACSLARLLACSLARLLACSLARLLACLLACLLAWTTSAVPPKGCLAFVPSSQVYTLYILCII